jgi:hypothetical protein
MMKHLYVVLSSLIYPKLDQAKKSINGLIQTVVSKLAPLLCNNIYVHLIARPLHHPGRERYYPRIKPPHTISGRGRAPGCRDGRSSCERASRRCLSRESVSVGTLCLSILVSELLNLHIGMLSTQITTCTEPSALNTGVALVEFSISQSYALKVRAKLKKFLKMIWLVKPSMVRSPKEVQR